MHFLIKCNGIYCIDNSFEEVTTEMKKNKRVAFYL